MPIPIAIALGSNLGDRAAHIEAAIIALAALPTTALLARSSLFETSPVGPIPQGPFLNAAATLSTSLPPHELLTHLHNIEAARGRDRSAGQRWGPRTLDLDILLYGDLVLHDPGLTIPHPRLRERAFVLLPLAHIAPDTPIPARPGESPTTPALALAALGIAPGPPSDPATDPARILLQPP